MTESGTAVFAKRALDTSSLGQKEGRGARIAGNAAIFVAATAADVVESKVFRVVSNAVFEGKTHRLQHELSHAQTKRNSRDYSSLNPSQVEQQKIADELEIKVVRDALRLHKAVESGVEFAEESLSDEALKTIGHAILNTWAGNMDGSKKPYVQETANLLSEYANGIIQVFFNDRWFGLMDENGQPKKFMGVMLAEKSMNFVNGFNVEAGLRILSDLPVVGTPVRVAKHASDHFLEHSPYVKWVNTAAAKFLLGFHVRNSMQKAVTAVSETGSQK